MNRITALVPFLGSFKRQFVEHFHYSFIYFLIVPDRSCVYKPLCWDTFSVQSLNSSIGSRSGISENHIVVFNPHRAQEVLLDSSLISWGVFQYLLLILLHHDDIYFLLTAFSILSGKPLYYMMLPSPGFTDGIVFLAIICAEAKTSRVLSFISYKLIHWLINMISFREYAK